MAGYSSLFPTEASLKGVQIAPDVDLGNMFPGQSAITATEESLKSFLSLTKAQQKGALETGYGSGGSVATPGILPEAQEVKDRANIDYGTGGEYDGTFMSSPSKYISSKIGDISFVVLGVVVVGVALALTAKNSVVPAVTKALK